MNITCNIWDDFLFHEGTYLYAESCNTGHGVPKRKAIEVLRRVLPYVRKAASQLKLRRFKAQILQPINTDSSLAFVRGTNDPIIKLDGINSDDTILLAEALNKMDIQIRTEQIRFISES